MKTNARFSGPRSRLLAIVLGLAAALVAAQAQDEPRRNASAVSNAQAVGTTTPPRFVVADVFVDSGAAALAVYQLDVAITNAPAKIVGIEGGEHPAFRRPPYYDPEAIQRERVILAAYNTTPGADLPKGRTRVASLHLRVDGATRPQFSVGIKVAAGPDGKPVPCTLEVIERNTP